MKGARQLDVSGVRWRYYRLGAGDPLLWLTGGLRRAAVGEEVLKRLALRHTVIAPDYPPIQTAGQFLDAVDAMLDREKVGPVAVLGQSYGGLLAQAYVAQRPYRVSRLILVSTWAWRLRPGVASRRVSGDRPGAGCAGTSAQGGAGRRIGQAGRGSARGRG